MEKISIIIPVYNAAKFLPKCIESCINQTYKSIEIILVIDGSPDDCYEISKFYEWKDPRINVINQVNKGVANARRVGFESSLGKYIYFLDADDYIESNSLEVLRDKLITEDADIAIGGTIYEDIYGNLVAKWINTISIKSKTDYLKAIFNLAIQPSIWGRLIKREIFQPVYIPCKLILGEDFLANIMMICYSTKINIVCDPSLLYHYVVYNDSITNTTKDENLMKYTDEISKILIKHNLEESVIEEWSYFRVVRTWRYYLRCGGKKYLKDKGFVKNFYNRYYSVIKKKLSLIERFELQLYKYNRFLAYNFSRIYVKLDKYKKLIREKIKWTSC